MSTYRERREARAERLREWAAKRDAKAGAAFDQAKTMGDAIPFGQPILVGHHSQRRDERYRNRIVATMDRAVEHAAKAADMGSRAAGIEAQLAASIYDDDPDAIERLTERIAHLEAERERIKAFNASCRKGAPDWALLTDRERKSLESVARVAPYSLGKGGGFPGYHLTNLGGNITRQRQRLARLERQRTV